MNRFGVAFNAPHGREEPAADPVALLYHLPRTDWPLAEGRFFLACRDPHATAGEILAWARRDLQSVLKDTARSPYLARAWGEQRVGSLSRLLRLLDTQPDEASRYARHIGQANRWGGRPR